MIPEITITKIFFITEILLQALELVTRSYRSSFQGSARILVEMSVSCAVLTECFYFSS